MQDSAAERFRTKRRPVVLTDICVLRRSATASRFFYLDLELVWENKTRSSKLKREEHGSQVFEQGQHRYRSRLLLIGAIFKIKSLRGVICNGMRRTATYNHYIDSAGTYGVTIIGHWLPSLNLFLTKGLVSTLSRIIFSTARPSKKKRIATHTFDFTTVSSVSANTKFVIRT